jgi:putative colanic acid biosynthesis UDP-glucose lipid carrier transferase
MRQLDPVVVVATLVVCMLIAGERFSNFYAGVGLLAYVTAAAVFGRFRNDRDGITPWRSAVYSGILLEWAAVVSVLLLLAFAFKITGVYSRSVMLSWFCVTPLVLCAAHKLRVHARAALSNRADAPRYIVIGANQVASELLRRLPQNGFLGFFDFRNAERISEWVSGDQLIGHCNDVADYVRDNGVTTIYIALPLAKAPRIGELIAALRDTTASVYFLPDVFSFDLVGGRLVNIGGMPALSVCDTPLHGMDAVLKRTLDVLLAGVALVLAAPVMTACAIGVKLSSPGPILFRQRRYGLHGEEIIVYKFRSMTCCEDGPTVAQAKKNDARTTRIGAFLRKYSLDELPQLLNVIQGKMSLVGPRPHAVAHNEQYRKLISGYMIRHKVRPGITGLAQVSGFRGETDTVEKMSGRIHFDIQYLNQWSIWLDIRILIRTVLLVLRDDKAY